MNNVAAIDPVAGVTVSDNPTERELAELLLARLGKACVVGSQWYRYADGVWQKTTRDALRPLAQRVLPESLRTARNEKEILNHLEGRLQTTDEQFHGFYKFDETGAVLLNVANGVVRVTAEEGTLLPHDACHMFTERAAAKYDPTARADRFAQLLQEALPDPDDRYLLQLCAGNLLLPDCRFEVALVCCGEAGRGKSTVAEAIAAVFGENDLISRLSMNQLCDPKSYSLPKLRYAAVNLGTELDAIAVEESANFKTIVSGEAVEVRAIYSQPFTMRTRAKLWFLANHLPRFKHGSDAEVRRLRFIRFDQVPAQKDVTLRDRVRAEADGVLLYMIAGLRRLLTLREIPLGSTTSQQIQQRFSMGNDALGAFVASECTLKPDGYVTKERLLQSFMEFAEKHGLPTAENANWVLRHLYERFPVKPRQRRIGGEKVWCVSGLIFNARLDLGDDELEADCSVTMS